MTVLHQYFQCFDFKMEVYSLQYQNRTCSGSPTQDLECGTNGSVHVDYQLVKIQSTVSEKFFKEKVHRCTHARTWFSLYKSIINRIIKEIRFHKFNLPNI